MNMSTDTGSLLPCLAKLGVHVRLTARANLLHVLVGIAARDVHEPFVQVTVDHLLRRRQVCCGAVQGRPFISSHVHSFIHSFVRSFVRSFIRSAFHVKGGF